MMPAAAAQKAWSDRHKPEDQRGGISIIWYLTFPLFMIGILWLLKSYLIVSSIILVLHTLLIIYSIYNIMKYAKLLKE